MGLSVICLAGAYVLVTWIGFVHTMVNARSGKYPRAKDLQIPMFKAPAYKATEPFHPLYNLVIFPIAAYINILLANTKDWSWAWKTALLWTIASIVVDWLGWIAIPHPARMTYRAFYVDYQPYITFIYLIVFMSPPLAFLVYQILH